MTALHSPFALRLSFDKLRVIGTQPFVLSLSFDKLRMIGTQPFALSLSKAFDKLSPFDKLRTRGGFDKLSPNGERCAP